MRSRSRPVAVSLGCVLAVAASVSAAMPDLGVFLATRKAAWNAMTDAEQARFVDRLEAWEALPYQVAGLRREQYLAWDMLDREDHARLRETRRLFAALPEDEQRALRERYAELNETEQHGWLLGPRLGADYPALSPLFLQVPPEQREPLLVVLRAMSDAEREDLAILAYRTPPQERDALRRALLETTPANRAAWLRLRLER